MRKMHDHYFGDASLSELDGPRGRVLPELFEVAKLAIRLSPYDGTVRRGGGVRTQAEAEDNARRKTGIVNSLHRIQADGFGHAIDVLALTPGKGVDYTNKKAFRAMYLAIEEAAGHVVHADPSGLKLGHGRSARGKRRVGSCAFRASQARAHGRRDRSHDGGTRPPRARR